MRALAREPADRSRMPAPWPRRCAHGVATRCALAGAGAAAAPSRPPPAGRRADRLRPAARHDARRSRTGHAAAHEAADEGQPWWMWLLAVLGVLLLGAIGFLGVQLFGGASPRRARRSGCQRAELRRRGADDASIAGGGPRLTLEREKRRRRTSTRGASSAASRRVARSGGGLDARRHRLERPRRGRRSAAARPDRAAGPRHACRSGLSVGSIDREPDPSVPEGSVIRSNPAEGVDVDAGSQVDLVISTGPTPSPTPRRHRPRRRRRRPRRPRCRRRPVPTPTTVVAAPSARHGRC